MASTLDIYLAIRKRRKESAINNLKSLGVEDCKKASNSSGKGKTKSNHKLAKFDALV